MVFQRKKGPAVVRNEQGKKGKKAFAVQEDDDDIDMSDDAMDNIDEDDDIDDSEEDTRVQKTPARKSLKGKQSLSEKKVSFQMPGRNTPAGKFTPKGNNALAKKTPTPSGKGKPGMQEFKGMQGNKPTPKKALSQDDDDDDDDEEEEDDDDEEDPDMDDLDEEEDDDEEEEEEEDDDEEDEDKGKLQKKTFKQQDNSEQDKQRSKGVNKPKNTDTPKGVQIQKSDIKSEKSPLKVSEAETIELERRRQRDAKMLYVGKLPKETTPDELKKLSSDILDIIMPLSNRSAPSRVTYAFLVFVSEKKAEENYQSLQSKKFRGQPLIVDFVGLKSKNKPEQAKQSQQNYNMKKLYVSGIPLGATIGQVAEFFPTAFQITFNHSATFRSATINFLTVEDADAAFNTNKNCVIDGVKLTVLHSLVTSTRKNKRKKGNRITVRDQYSGGDNMPAAKKMRFSSVSQKEDDDE